jgi:5-methylcytosine-specific restriction endonuclease McrA
MKVNVTFVRCGGRGGGMSPHRCHMHVWRTSAYRKVDSRGKDHGLTKAGRRILKKLVERAEGKCVYCDRYFGSHIPFLGGKRPYILYASLDHFIPINRSGTDDESNLLAACRLCNAWKVDSVFDDIQAARNYLRERWESAINHHEE